MDAIEQQQRQICQQHGVAIVPAPSEFKVGISSSALEGGVPLNGLRHPAVGDTTGWYIWAGEGDPSEDPMFFMPLHVKHLAEYCPAILGLLGMPPGWRFLVVGEYVDIWEDSAQLAL